MNRSVQKEMKAKELLHEFHELALIQMIPKQFWDYAFDKQLREKAIQGISGDRARPRAQ